MKDSPRIRKLKARVKNFLDYNDLQIKRWWFTPNPAFGGKTPNDMALNPKSLKKMETIISFSSRNIIPKDHSLKPKTLPSQRVQGEFDI
jgi:hypothetical protein